ncbi:MAG: hypothetical protein KDD64_14790 [Bdellovibrionales bacterium]|nr:hypothetical protein [Bdellovibrionales bacterium]
MKRSLFILCVNCLTAIVTLSGCSTLQFTEQETCSNHPFIRSPIESYLSQRFPKGAPVRVGVVPFTAPANVAASSDEMPGLGNEIAWRLKNELLASGAFPIVQLLNRQEWPGQREEFRSGNFDSIGMAKAAGFDLVLVGAVENFTSLDSLSIQTKLIEVESGITVWNGRSLVHSNHIDREKTPLSSWFIGRNPSSLPTGSLMDELAHCILEGMLSDEPAPY